MSLEQLQNRYTAPRILGRLAYLAGLLPEPQEASAEELLAVFSWDKVPKTDILLPDGLF